MVRQSTIAQKAARKGPGRKGYSEQKRARILETAKREKLTGRQVAKRFGISTLTFYRWRGPVRRRRSASRARASVPAVRIEAVRKAVRAQIRKTLPRILREEVERALST